MRPADRRLLRATGDRPGWIRIDPPARPTGVRRQLARIRYRSQQPTTPRKSDEFRSPRRRVGQPYRLYANWSCLAPLATMPERHEAIAVLGVGERIEPL